jgi:hypothetical protein
VGKTDNRSGTVDSRRVDPAPQNKFPGPTAYLPSQRPISSSPELELQDKFCTHEIDPEPTWSITPLSKVDPLSKTEPQPNAKRSVNLMPPLLHHKKPTSGAFTSREKISEGKSDAMAMKL